MSALVELLLQAGCYGNDKEKIAAMLINTGALAVLRGGLVECDIYHDDWCRIWRGAECDCEPEVHFRKGVRDDERT